MVVTNGNGPQMDKLVATGSSELTERCWVSGMVGSAKPDAAIFRTAAQMWGAAVIGAWMVGDDPEKDSLGAARLGMRTAWLANGRTWPAALPAPTVIAHSFASAVALCLGEEGSGSVEPQVWD